jgi:hypothetical protein
MQMIRSACQTTVAALMLVLATGCEPATEPLAMVHGKVSYKGRPLSTGTIVFTPDVQRGTVGPMARSEIQPDGTYILQSKGVRGATAGWHRVTVMALESSSPNDPVGAPIVPRSLLPEKYRDPELSGLSCRIEGGRENSFDFDLEE